MTTLLYILEDDNLNEELKNKFLKTRESFKEGDAMDLVRSIFILSQILTEYHKEKVIILIDEYDTPIIESWTDGAYDEAIMFFKQFFNYTLKSNPYVEKALLTGITRISKESMFSDMNHIRVSTMTDKAFSEFFGFTEEEVFAAMDSQELSDKETVKAWYDGFKIGDREDMYNPWSISYYLETGRIGTYWVNTSSNEMVEKIMRSSDVDFKIHTEQLLLGKEIKVTLNEDIVFKDLDMENIRSSDKSMIWGLLFSAGYLKAVDFDLISGEYTLRVTNKEIEIMLERMFDRWFHNTVERDYKDFVKAMLSGDEENMNDALEDIAWETFSVFDVGGKTASKTAENFYHGFFLGLITTLRKEYRITSNRESGRGRYDCMLEPLDSSKKAIVIEFKVRKKKEANLKEAAEDAIEQIKKMHYAEELKHRGFSDEQILSYGIAFDGKETMVLMA